MKVKWNGQVSSERNLNGGGPHGGLMVILEHLSQKNNNADFLPDFHRRPFYPGYHYFLDPVDGFEGGSPIQMGALHPSTPQPRCLVDEYFSAPLIWSDITII